MATSKPISYFGVHSVLFYRRPSKKAYGVPLKVIGNFNLDLPSEFADLNGGSEKYLLDSEVTTITPEVSLLTREFRLYLYEILLAAQTTELAAEASGNVSALENVDGTSVFDATTGIASVAVKSGEEGNLKFGKLQFVATGADTINVVYSSDIDFRRGTDVSYQNDELEVLAADVTIPGTGGTVDIDELGITITGGSGTIAFVVDDAAEMDVRPVNQGADIITIGQSGTINPEFGCIMYAQQRNSQQMFEIEIYKCIAGGFPHGFEEKAFVESEITLKPLKDFDNDVVMEIRRVRP